MNKVEAYKELFKMEKQGFNIDNILKELATSKRVTEDILFKMNQLKTYPVFLKQLKEKKFFKNILDDSLDDIEKAKALSSLVTHTLIEFQNIEESEIKNLSEAVYIDEVLEALNLYMTEGNSNKLNEVRDKLVVLFNK